MDHSKTLTGEFPRHLPDCKCATCLAAEDKRRRAWERLKTPERSTEIEHVAGAYVRQLIASGHLVREDGKWWRSASYFAPDAKVSTDEEYRIYDRAYRDALDRASAPPPELTCPPDGCGAWQRDRDLCPAHRKQHEQQAPQQLSLGEKVAYVRQEGHEPPKGHVCHADGCEVEIAPAFLMCPRHWRMVPKPLQAAVWRYFRPGQEQAKDPSPAYLAAMLAAVRSVAEQEGRVARPRGTR